MAVAAESQGHAKSEAYEGSGLGAAAKKAGIKVPSLKDLVTKPGAVVGMLRAIMNVLKLRWPAFIGTNVLWSLALFSMSFSYALSEAY